MVPVPKNANVHADPRRQMLPAGRQVNSTSTVACPLCVGDCYMYYRIFEEMMGESYHHLSSTELYASGLTQKSSEKPVEPSHLPE